MDIAFTVRASRMPNGGLKVRYGIALWYRLISAGIFIALMATIAAAGGTGLVGYVALTISVLAAAWNESWLFDTDNRFITGAAGLAGFFRPRSISFDEVEAIAIVEFHRVTFTGAAESSSLPGSQARLVLRLKEEASVTLNSVALKNKAALQRDAVLLSELTGLVFKAE